MDIHPHQQFNFLSETLLKVKRWHPSHSEIAFQKYCKWKILLISNSATVLINLLSLCHLVIHNIQLPVLKCYKETSKKVNISSKCKNSS